MNKITDEEWARFSAEFRKSDPREELASPVLTDKQWIVYGELQRALRHPEHFQFGLFAGASISAFFDPEHPSLRNSFKNERFETSVLFAITDRELAGLPKLFVLDDFFDAPMLCHLKAPHLFWEENSDPKEFAKKVLQRLAGTAPTNLMAQKAVVNRSELLVGRQLIINRITDYQYLSLADNDEIDGSQLEELKRKFPKMLREVALTRLAPIRMRRLSIELQKKLNRMNIDILVHSVVPNIPILAIEVDGDHHLDAHQVTNDLIKDRILKTFGIPLLRVLPTERAKFLSSSFSANEESRLFVSMFVFIASQIALHSKHAQMSYIDWVKLRHALEQFQENLSKSYFDKPYDTLNEQQRERVTSDVIFSKPFEDMQEFEREEALFEEHFDLSDPALTTPLSKHCSQLSISKDSSEVWTFKAIFKYEGIIEVIPSPRIKLFADFLGDQLVEKIIKVSFLNFVKNWVEDRLRN